MTGVGTGVGQRLEVGEGEQAETGQVLAYLESLGIGEVADDLGLQ